MLALLRVRALPLVRALPRVRALLRVHALPRWQARHRCAPAKERWVCRTNSEERSSKEDAPEPQAGV